MSRTLSSTISSAITATATRPIYLVEMGFDTVTRVATWDSLISWGGYSWSASGVSVKGLNSSGTRLMLPNGADDPWLSLVLNQGTRDRTISIWEHHRDESSSPQEDAVLVFTGIMDEASITDKIMVSVLDTSRAKTFPVDSVDQPKFTHLMTSGDTIVWGNKTITVS